MFYTDPRFWLYAATLTPYLLCLLLYGTRSPWREHRIGRALFALYAALVAVLLFAVIALTGIVPVAVANVLRFVLLGGVCVAGYWQLIEIVRLQRQARSPDNH